MSCIYEGYWIYGLGVFCLKRPLFGTFPHNSYYSNVCVNFGDYQAQQTSDIRLIQLEMVLYTHQLSMSA